MEVLWFGYMEEVVCNGDDLILNPLFNFEPMKGLEQRGDVRMFGIPRRIEHKLCVIVCKALHGMVPACINELSIPATVTERSLTLRSSRRYEVYIPRTKTKFGEKGFRYAGPYI